MSLELNNQTYLTDEEGYLDNLDDWSVALAGQMAKKDGYALTENHWEVINFLREYYGQYQIAPAVRILTKAIGKRLAKKKATANTCTSYFPMVLPSRRVNTQDSPNPPGAFEP